MLFNSVEYKEPLEGSKVSNIYRLLALQNSTEKLIECLLLLCGVKNHFCLRTQKYFCSVESRGRTATVVSAFLVFFCM